VSSQKTAKKEAKMAMVYSVKRRHEKFILAILVVLLVVPASALGVFYLWNWLMPQIFGVHSVTYWQSLGLLGLSWLLFRGPRFGSRPGWGGRGGVRTRWEVMTPEERIQFVKGLESRCGRTTPPEPSTGS
jgi:Ca2+/H+ antiporter, TMEM165/GDT1 family